MSKDAFQQQRKQFNAHLQFHRLYFKANDMDFVFQWLMGSAVHGGAGIGESFYAASRIKDGDPKSWKREWIALGERIQKRAESALASGHIVSGREAYLRATVYYRAALAAMLPTEPEFNRTIDLMKACFQKGSTLLDPPVEPVSIQFEGIEMQGYFQKAAADDKSRPTLLMVGGAETFTEDLFYFIAPAALRRGYNFMTIDLPGQGDLPAKGLFFRADFETPMKVIIDHVLERTDVDPDRLAVYGISAGGYIVSRAAAYEKRIKACVANSMIFDMDSLFRESPVSN